MLGTALKRPKVSLTAAARICQTRRQDLPDGLLVLELYLGLGGVYVDVDVLGVHVEVDEVGHLLARGDEAFVGFHHGLVEVGVAHVATVDKEVLVRPLLAGGLGLGHEAAYPYQGGLHLQGEELLVHLLSEHGHHALPQRHGREVQEFDVIVQQGERHGGMHQRDALELGHDVGEFGAVGLEELAACRHVEEEVLHQEIAAAGAGRRLLALHLRAGNQQAGAQLVLLAAGLQLHLGHGGYGGQGLAAEAHGVQGKEVRGFAYLGRGMPLERQAGVGLGHSLAVIYDLYGGLARIGHQHVHLLGIGIDGVLHQFLDHGGRTLYDLACGNLVGHGVGQQMNNVTHITTILSYKLLS